MHLYRSYMSGLTCTDMHTQLDGLLKQRSELGTHTLESGKSFSAQDTAILTFRIIYTQPFKCLLLNKIDKVKVLRKNNLGYYLLSI